MAKIWIAIADFSRGEEAASLVEYAMLLALITVLCIGALSLLGNQISNFMGVSDSI